jgi:hypothetical protein
MTAADGRPRPGDRVARWHAAAYGLNLTGGVCVLGLSRHGAPATVGLPQVELELVGAIASPGAAQAVVAGTPGGLMIESLPAGGYRMSGPGVGSAEIEPDAVRVLIEPPREDGWLWNRWVLGQVLPFVAALHGRELLHAGGVVVGEEAVAILGPSGRGKSTLVGALVQAGASFMADDVIAIESRPPHVLAHPGPGVLVRAEPRFLVPGGPWPLSTICGLHIGERLRVETLTQPEPAALLSNVYERVRRDPERLASQLSLLSELAAGTRFIRIQRGADTQPGQLAGRLLEHLAAG